MSPFGHDSPKTGFQLYLKNPFFSGSRILLARDVYFPVGAQSSVSRQNCPSAWKPRVPSNHSGTNVVAHFENDRSKSEIFVINKIQPGRCTFAEIDDRRVFENSRHKLHVFLFSVDAEDGY